jgi:hypothetical protein
VTKAAVELALLAAHASRLHATTNHPVAYSRILDFLTEVFARQTVTSYCARDRDNSLLYGLASTALGVCGRPNHKLEWVVRQTLYVTNSLHAERTPFRELDLLHLLHLRGDAHPTLKADDVFKRTLSTNGNLFRCMALAKIGSVERYSSSQEG